MRHSWTLAGRVWVALVARLLLCRLHAPHDGRNGHVRQHPAARREKHERRAIKARQAFQQDRCLGGGAERGAVCRSSCAKPGSSKLPVSQTTQASKRLQGRFRSTSCPAPRRSGPRSGSETAAPARPSLRVARGRPTSAKHPQEQVPVGCPTSPPLRALAAFRTGCLATVPGYLPRGAQPQSPRTARSRSGPADGKRFRFWSSRSAPARPAQ